MLLAYVIHTRTMSILLIDSWLNMGTFASFLFIYIIPKVNLRFYRKFTVFAKYYFTKEISIDISISDLFTWLFYRIMIIERFSRISEIIKQAK